MDAPMLVALLLAAAIVLLAIGTGGGQVRAWRRLADRRHVPSDERRFLRARYRRRFVTAGVLLLLGGLLAGAYLSGMERRADALGAARAGAADGPKPPLGDDDRAFLRFWGLYWVGAMALVFALIVLAFADVWATHRFLRVQLRTLREDHHTKLRRDLAVLRSERSGGRGAAGWRRGGDERGNRGTDAGSR